MTTITSINWTDNINSSREILNTNFNNINNDKLESSDVADFETSAQLDIRDTDNRSRVNHTWTQTASTISDFDIEVSNNADVAANTSHRTNTTNPHSVTKTQVGLWNVDNTSDADKPISTATQTALDAKQNILAEWAFVDWDKTKLDWIEAWAEVNTINSDPTWVTWADQVTNVISLTQAEYDAIWTPDASTIYNITDATTSVDWGNISWTLSNQTDLQTELDAKANLAWWNTFTGTQSVSSWYSQADYFKTNVSTSFVSWDWAKLYKQSTLWATLQWVTWTTNDLTLITPTGISLLTNPTWTNNVAMWAVGNVWIGTTTPWAKLDVNWTLSSWALQIDWADTFGSWFTLSNEWTYKRIQSYWGQDISINPLGNDVMIWQTTSAGKLSITQGWNADWLNLSVDWITTANWLDVLWNNITTWRIARFYSNSASFSWTNWLVDINVENASATWIALRVKNDWSGNWLNIDQNWNWVWLYFVSDATTKAWTFLYSNAIRTWTWTNSLVSVFQDNASSTWTALDVRNDWSWLTLATNWKVRHTSLPTSATWLSSWDIWNNAGVLNIV